MPPQLVRRSTSVAVAVVRGDEYRFEDCMTLSKASAFVIKEAHKARKVDREALKKEGDILEPIKRGRGRPPKNS